MNESLRAELLCKRREILQRIAPAGGDAEPGAAADGDRSMELESLDMLFELDAASRLELGRINRTLERIDEGSYGRCSRCGQPIEAARLRAAPHAEICAACASRDEGASR